MKKEKSAINAKYLYASGRIRALEPTLLTPDKLIRLIQATVPEGYRVLAECGYELSGGDVNASGSKGIYAISKLLNSERERLFILAEKISGNTYIVNFFRAELDCHNIKAVLKSDYLGGDAGGLLLSGGTFEASWLGEILKSGKFAPLGKTWADAAEKAKEILSKTGDGQLCDFALDLAMQDICDAYAEKSESVFMRNYARFRADSANLKAAVRL
jgi:V/A-type H+-transporting ATPase subunit C